MFLPVVFKTPETGWAGGASGAYYFKTDSVARVSFIQALGFFTQRGQNVQAIDATVYFPREKNIFYFHSSHIFFPDRFWGVGQKSLDEWKETYQFEQIRISPHLKHRFGKHFFAGLLSEFRYVYHTHYKTEGIFDSTALNGKMNYKTLGAGISLGFDNRNSTYWPTRGCLAQVLYSGFYKGLGSDYEFSKIIVDARFFRKTFFNQVLALQLYSYATFGQTPYRDLAALGGENNLRGMYTGRFRDKSLYSVIAEYRIPFQRKFAAVMFGGLGDVFDSPEKINTETIKYNFGAGFRAELLPGERLNLRIDYGYINRNNHGLYLTIGECF